MHGFCVKYCFIKTSFNVKFPWLIIALCELDWLRMLILLSDISRFKETWNTEVVNP